MTGIPTDAFYTRSAGSLSLLRARAETLQTQIATGQRLERASDDPVAARQLRQIADQDAMAKVYDGNAAIIGADLALAETALSELTNLAIRAQELATQAANGTLSVEQRKINGNELAQIHSDMVALLNGKDSTGNPLFAGNAQGPAYTVAADGSASYAGSGEPTEVAVGDGVSVPRGLNGPDFIDFSVDGVDTDLLSVVHSLAVSLQSGSATAASDAGNALKGLTAGIGALTTGQAVIGARQGRIELATSLAAERGEVRASDKIRLGTTDMPVAIAELQEMMTVLEASQASFSKLSGLSLFDYLG